MMEDASPTVVLNPREGRPLDAGAPAESGDVASATRAIEPPAQGVDPPDTIAGEAATLSTSAAAIGHPPGAPDLSTVADPVVGRDCGDTAGARVPGYAIEDELGRGGMGVVYQARQIGLNRTVALKMILAGAHAGRMERERFRTEAESVARLHHPNIVQIYEVGEAGGLPFFSLEFVEGGGLDRRLDGTPWPVRDAVALVHSLARAVHAAHLKGVVHRDLKPANILMTGDNQPKITDFGLAKRIDSEAGQTQSGSILGTPSYMAPEQAGGQTRRIGPASDIYGLGAILYELLTGRPPFKAATPLETVRLVISDDPVSPSRLRPGLPRDLETIVLACLQKEPVRRYASAEALADDLERFLRDEPVHARPVGVGERAVKWIRRRPAIAALVGLLGLAVTLGIAGFAWRYRTESRLRKQAEFARRQADEQREQAERQRRLAEAVRAEVEVERARAHSRLNAASTNLAYQEWLAGNPGRGARLLDSIPDDERRWEWDYLDGLMRNQARTFGGHPPGHQVTQVAFADDGRSLVSATNAGSVRVWDATTGSLISNLQVEGAGLAISPDGRLCATAASQVCAISDLTTGKEVAKLSGGLIPMPLFPGGFTSTGAFAADGRRFATGSVTSIVYVWDVASPAPLHLLKGHQNPPFAVAISRDGRRIASISPTQPPLLGIPIHAARKPELRIWDAETGKLVSCRDAPRDGTHSLAFATDGARLAGAGMDGLVRVWDVSGGGPVELRGHRGFVYGATFSPDGRRLASSGFDRTIRVWDLGTSRTTTILRGHDLPIFEVVFSPDGRRLASGALDGTVKLWNLPGPSESGQGAESQKEGDSSQEYLTLRGHGDRVQAIAFRPGTTEIATGGWDGVVRLVGSETGRTRLTYPAHRQPISSVAFNRDGSRAVSASGGLLGVNNGDVRVWDPETGRELAKMHAGHGPIAAAAISPDGSRVVSAVGGLHWSQPGQLKLWDAATGHELASAPEPVANIVGLVYAPDGRRVATVGGDPGIRLWDPDGLKPAYTLAKDMNFRAVAYSRDGRRLAAASFADAAIRVFDTATGREVGGRLGGHGVGVYALAFDAHADRLASAGGDALVKLWDLRESQEVLSLHQHDHEVYAVAFGPDDRLLASAGYDGAIRIRGLATPTLPETSDWPVIFTDDFSRADIAGRWITGSGTWSVEEGALKGVLGAVPNDVSQATATLVGPKLPTTVAIELDFWSPEPNVVEAALLTASKTEGVLASICYPKVSGDVQLGEPGGRLWVRSAGTFLVAQAPRFQARPGVHYRMRVVRMPDRLTVLVDGRKILSVAVPSLDARGLELRGVFGPFGSAIYFDNIEIRAPTVAEPTPGH